YRPFSGFSQANAPAPSIPVTTTVNTIVGRYGFVSRSYRIRPPSILRCRAQSASPLGPAMKPPTLSEFLIERGRLVMDAEATSTSRSPRTARTTAPPSLLLLGSDM